MNVDEALHTRISVRAYEPRPVAREVLEDLLAVASRSPSGGNLQPWKVIVVAGAAQTACTELAQRTLAANPAGEAGSHPIYPADLWEPHRSRRYQVGEDMYALLGIPREDKPARFQWVARNYQFFGAPVGLFFVIDRRMGHGQWAHLGMFMQSIALAAVQRGLGTCMQEAWGMVRQSLGAHFGLAETEMVYCGMALGWPDATAAVNQLRTAREPVAGFARFEGFE
jgi:nitroreductase